MAAQNDCAPAAANGRGAGYVKGLHADSANPEVLLQRLDGVQKVGNGWRARCPACGGSSRKLSVAVSDNRVLVHCFGCSDANAVIGAAGLSWADLQPPRYWPQNEDDRRSARRAIREAGWASALRVLALESQVVLIAGREFSKYRLQTDADDLRLALAVRRIEGAANVLTEPVAWRPKAAA